MKAAVPRDTAYAMSEENVEVVRRGVTAWNQGNLDEVLAVLHPDVEFRPEAENGRPTFPGVDASYIGHEGYRKFWRDFYAIFEEISIEIERTVSDSEHVAFLSRFHGVVREGAAADRMIAASITMRDGLVWRYFNFSTWDEALEAAGQSE